MDGSRGGVLRLSFLKLLFRAPAKWKSTTTCLGQPTKMLMDDMFCDPKNDSKNYSDHSLATVYGIETKYSDLPLIKPNFPETGDIIAFKVSRLIGEFVTGRFLPLSVISDISPLQEICA